MLQHTEYKLMPDKSWRRAGLYILLALLILRLVLMIWLPLTDTTEARYSEIARKMLETGNWVTLQHDYGVPFWAKPPLSTWLSALSMAIFGQNAFAARLPSLLLSLAVIALISHVAYHRAGAQLALAVAVILSSSLLFFGTAGTSMTDSALVFCTSLILVAFWRSINGAGRAWGYAFFIGIGLGLLAKGPVALVLSGLPIFVWVLLRKQWIDLWQRLPWLSGSLLSLLIAAPWYIWAELRTPGFLNYFIVGEHIQRFLDPGWQGDKYGFAHAVPHGMIWPFAFVGLLPWSLMAPLWWLKQRAGKNAIGATPVNDGWTSFLLLWACMPLAFFSLSGNIIFPYTLPMLPGAALLFAQLCLRANAVSRLPLIAGLTSVLAIVALIVLVVTPGRVLNTQKVAIAHWQALHPDADSQLLYWRKQRLFSAEFYSNGRARTLHNSDTLRALLANANRAFLLIEEQDLPQLPSDLLARFERLDTLKIKDNTLLILGEPALSESNQ